DAENNALAQRFAGVYRAHRCRGAALGLFNLDGLHTHLVFGNARKNALVDRKTVFRIASVSKMVTAALVMRLHETGKIGLDDDLDQVMPYSLRHPKAAETPVTLRMLLTHTAGISDGKAYMASLGQDVQAETLLGQDCHTVHLPGSGCEYSNFGVGLAACALEASLGQAFEELAQEWLFHPLGMNSSFYPHCMEGPVADAWRVLPPRAKPAFDGNAKQRAFKEGWDRPDPQTHYSLAQGNCCMDVESAARLGQALLRPGDLSAASLEAMRTPAASLSQRDPALTQGIGTFLLKDPEISDNPLFGHQGMAYGAVHMIFMDPGTGEGLISFTSGASVARRHILADINRDLIAVWQEKK
ncbi:MAG: serine hydrolase, partial [Eubacteriales bacterium]|nr:serine hydrolase [Eubacteriales bacterium]